MLTWEAAREKVLNGVGILNAVERPVSATGGLVLAKDLRAPVAMPPFDNSAMDGFAVRAGDVSGAGPDSPKTLEVVGVQPAGRDRGLTLGPGEAVRIMTGAPIPSGADAVVMVEVTSFWDEKLRRARIPANQQEGKAVQIYKKVTVGTNIRRAGESVAQDSVMLTAGHLLHGAEIGLCLSVGIWEARVHPRPRVGVLSTGDELVQAGKPRGPGEIWDSNRPALLATLKELGFPTLDLGQSGDDPAELEQKIHRGVQEADFLLTSGGVSVGDYDLTREIFERMGSVEWYQVAVKPGKPQLFGTVEDTPVFGLPGNPVSSLVVFDQFVLPGLRKMSGRRDFLPEPFPARLADRIERKTGRVEFLRVKLTGTEGNREARSTGAQGSGILSSLTQANGYAILPADQEVIEAGSLVSCVWRQ